MRIIFNEFYKLLVQSIEMTLIKTPYIRDSWKILKQRLYRCLIVSLNPYLQSSSSRPSFLKQTSEIKSSTDLPCTSSTASTALNDFQKCTDSSVIINMSNILWVVFRVRRQFKSIWKRPWAVKNSISNNGSIQMVNFVI